MAHDGIATGTPFDALLDKSCELAAERADYMLAVREGVEELAADWLEWTGRPAPSTETAYAELAAVLYAEGDLAPSQVKGLLATLCPDPDLPLHLWLQRAAERLVLRARPWFPLWLAYTDWVLGWCRWRGYRQLIFLGRDSLPLYTAARQLHAEREDLRLAMVDVPRALLEAPQLGDHVGGTIDPRYRTVLVDTGCYGTVITRLADHLAARAGRVDDPNHVATMFFSSRNPHIFGYLNYLMGWYYLADCRRGPGCRGPMDFVIYACDVLESLPKPYVVEIGPRKVSRRPADLASFVLSMRLCAELARHLVHLPLPTIVATAAAANELYAVFQQTGTPVARSALLLDSAAPKNPPHPAVMARLGMLSRAPQSEVFGHFAG